MRTLTVVYLMEIVQRMTHILFDVLPVGIVLVLFALPLLLLVGLVNQALYSQVEIADSVLE